MSNQWIFQKTDGKEDAISKVEKPGDLGKLTADSFMFGPNFSWDKPNPFGKTKQSPEIEAKKAKLHSFRSALFSF